MKRRSDLKERVAQNLRDAFKARDLLCNVFPGDFRCVEGFWKRADVYRWQIYVDLWDGIHWQRVEVSSWATLKECARKGMTVDPPNFNRNGWEADPFEEKR